MAKYVIMKRTLDIGKIGDEEAKEVFDNWEGVKDLVDNGNAVIYACPVCPGEVHVGRRGESSYHLASDVAGWVRDRALSVLESGEGAELVFEVDEKPEPPKPVEPEIYDPAKPQSRDRYYLALVDQDGSVILRVVDADGELAPAGNLLLIDKSDGRINRCLAVKRETVKRAGLDPELGDGNRIRVTDT